MEAAIVEGCEPHGYTFLLPYLCKVQESWNLFPAKGVPIVGSPEAPSLVLLLLCFRMAPMSYNFVNVPDAPNNAAGLQQVGMER